MRFSLDDLVSQRIFDVDNRLAPFHRSISCLGIIVLAAFANLSIWRSAADSWASRKIILSVISIAGVALLWKFRSKLAMMAPSGGSEPTQSALRSISDAATALCGLLQAALFLHG